MIMGTVDYIYILLKTNSNYKQTYTKEEEANSMKTSTQINIDRKLQKKNKDIFIQQFSTTPLEIPKAKKFEKNKAADRWMSTPLFNFAG